MRHVTFFAMTVQPDRNISGKVLSPEDCLLLVGLPLTKEDFFRSVRIRQSYAASYLGDSSDIEWGWQKMSCGFVEPCKREIAKIRQIGGKVALPSLDEESVMETQRCSVIVVFTHSLWSVPARSDVRDIEGLAESLMFGDGLPSVAFRAWFDRLATIGGEDCDSPMTESIFSTLVSACEFSHHWWGAPPGKRKAVDPSGVENLVAQNLCRPEVDREFAKHIQPDKGIEFGGRFCTVAELVSCFANTDQGRILDLRMCNSGMIANSVKASRPESLVVINQWQTNPLFALFGYVAVLRHLKQHRCSYISACERIHLAALDGLYQQ